MYQNMLRNKMTPLGWTLNLELGTGQLGRCWCWAPKVLDTVYWADVELLKRSFSRRNWSPSVSCGRFSAPTVTLTRRNQHHSHFHPHPSLFFDTFYCCYAIMGSINKFWMDYSSTSLQCALLQHFKATIIYNPSSLIVHFPEFFTFISNAFAQNVQEAHSPLFSGSTKSRSQITSSRGCRTARAATMLSTSDSLIITWLH